MGWTQVWELMNNHVWRPSLCAIDMIYIICKCVTVTPLGMWYLAWSVYTVSLWSFGYKIIIITSSFIILDIRGLLLLCAACSCSFKYMSGILFNCPLIQLERCVYMFPNFTNNSIDPQTNCVPICGEPSDWVTDQLWSVAPLLHMCFKLCHYVRNGFLSYSQNCVTLSHSGLDLWPPNSAQFSPESKWMFVSHFEEMHSCCYWDIAFTRVGGTDNPRTRCLRLWLLLLPSHNNEEEQLRKCISRYNFTLAVLWKKNMECNLTTFGQIAAVQKGGYTTLRKQAVGAD